MKTEITKKDEMSLIGIKTIANKLLSQMTMLTKMTAEIIDEELDKNDYGHSSDFLYCEDVSVGELLNRFEIKIEG